MKTYIFTNIKYDTNGQIVEGLPTELTLNPVVAQELYDDNVDYRDDYETEEEFMTDLLFGEFGEMVGSIQIERTTDWLVESFDLKISEFF